jgi:hypothetical protein
VNGIIRGWARTYAQSFFSRLFTGKNHLPLVAMPCDILANEKRTALACVSLVVNQLIGVILSKKNDCLEITGALVAMLPFPLSNFD